MAAPAAAFRRSGQLSRITLRSGHYVGVPCRLATLVEQRSTRLLVGNVMEACGSLLGLVEALYVRTDAAKDRTLSGADGVAALLHAAPGGPGIFLHVLAALTKLDQSSIKDYLEGSISHALQGAQSSVQQLL